MATVIGTRLGPYEVTAQIGAGGMGEVYKARDMRLGRDVAIKVLPTEFAADPDRLRRFEQEARAVAALDHPNILAIHDVGTHEGAPYIVTELLDGESLRARLSGGAMPVRRAVETAVQIAQGLAAAHEKGIVHRDLKPGNVFVTKDGHVKILDFGLAKLAAPRSRDDRARATTVMGATDIGTVLGTVAYMSPEQVRGQAVDQRSDIFAFGVVLYEMLSGKRAFGGDTAADTMSAILTKEPADLSGLDLGVTPSLERVVRRCLEKDANQRFESAHDVVFALEVASAASGPSSVAAVTPLPSRRRTVVRWTLATLVAAVVVAIAVVAPRTFRRGAAGARQFDIALPKGYRLHGPQNAFDISPDGRRIVFAASPEENLGMWGGEPKLFIRDLDAPDAVPLPGGEGGFQPVFSPDGKWIAFAILKADAPQLMKLPADGGTPTTIYGPGGRFGIAWAGDSLILGCGAGAPLMRVPVTGGKAEPITRLDEKKRESAHRFPHMLPDGKTVIYTAVDDHSRIYAQRLGSQERTLLVEDGSDGRWSPPGVLLFAREGVLMCAGLSSSGLALTSTPEAVVEGVQHFVWGEHTLLGTLAAEYAVSDSGALVFAPGGPFYPERPQGLSLVDATGRETALNVPQKNWSERRVSPDGKQLLLTRLYRGDVPAQTLDLERGSLRRVTLEEGGVPWAIWGPGPGMVTYTGVHEGIGGLYTRRLDAPPGDVEKLWGAEAHALGSWSPDGRLLAFTVQSEKQGHDIWLLTRGGQARPLVASRFDERGPEISPNGRWLAYLSDEPGSDQVMVRPLLGPGVAQQVSTLGGYAVMWTRDGKALVYSSSGDIFRVKVEEKSGVLELGLPEKLFSSRKGLNESSCGRNWDIGPDGRLVVTTAAMGAEQREFLEQSFPNRLHVDLDGVPALIKKMHTATRP